MPSGQRLSMYQIEEVTAWRVIGEDGNPVDDDLYEDYDEAYNALLDYRDEEDVEESVRNERW